MTTLSANAMRFMTQLKEERCTAWQYLIREWESVFPDNLILKESVAAELVGLGILRKHPQGQLSISLTGERYLKAI
jgi:hypothetical protein